MTPEDLSTADIARWRLQTQGLTDPQPGPADDVVRRLVAVQSQDFAPALWSLGERCGASEAEVLAAFDAGAVIRTHVLRPTWHFVAPDDLRWLLALTAPRVHATNAYMYRRTGLDDAVLARAHEVLREAQYGGRFRTRDELQQALGEAGIEASGQRLGYVLMHAELEGLVCSGPRRGRQQTYALVVERVPPGRELARDEALAELARQYAASRGPTTSADLATWSGLSRTEASRAVGHGVG